MDKAHLRRLTTQYFDAKCHQAYSLKKTRAIANVEQADVKLLYLAEK